MDNKITLITLAQMLSERTGRSRKECEDLLRSFFQHISSSLAAGEAVKVRGFGTFKISQVDARMSVDISSGQDFEIPAHNRIVFLPARELAGAVNAPFEMFETIELSDAVSDDELQNVERAENFPDDEQEPEEDSPAADDREQPEDAPSPEEPVQELPEQPEDAPSLEEPAQELPEQSETEVEEELPATVKSRFGHGFVWGMVAAVLIIVIGVVACYWLNEDFAGHVDQMTGRATSLKTPGDLPAAGEKDPAMPNAVADAEMIAEGEAGVDGIMDDEVPDQALDADKAVPTKPSDAVVYDTVRPHSGLGVMARKHYGNFHFWPYIYKENEKILGHPDRITPGTKVIIPPLSKYGVDPKNPDDIARAKRLDAEIYARYKKSKPR